LRIHFFRRGTISPDFYRQEEGCVSAQRFDKYIHVIIKKRFDDKIRVGNTRTETGG
jgi:galactokinase/mevalonate kinase-like predicted kinase